MGGAEEIAFRCNRDEAAGRASSVVRPSLLVQRLHGLLHKPAVQPMLVSYTDEVRVDWVIG